MRSLFLFLTITVFNSRRASVHLTFYPRFDSQDSNQRLMLSCDGLICNHCRWENAGVLLFPLQNIWRWESKIRFPLCVLQSFFRMTSVAVCLFADMIINITFNGRHRQTFHAMVSSNCQKESFPAVKTCAPSSALTGVNVAAFFQGVINRMISFVMTLNESCY